MLVCGFWLKVSSEDWGEKMKYEYQAVVDSVYDGDTVTVDVDLGFGIWLRGQKIRLFGVDAPEVRGEERESGLKSRDWLRNEVLEKSVVLETVRDKKGKYGRWLGILFLSGENVNKKLISQGLAKAYAS